MKAFSAVCPKTSYDIIAFSHLLQGNEPRIGVQKSEDIVNGLRGYRQRPARISSTACEDILTKMDAYTNKESSPPWGHLPKRHASIFRTQKGSPYIYNKVWKQSGGML